MSSRASLNHVYRLVWNPAMGVVIACGLSAGAWANPNGGVVVHGQATFTTTANTLTVTTQNGAGTNFSAIDWQTFSIPAGNQTYIQQPNAGSFSLNRVVTNTPSQIFGTLSSNGSVVLVNQSGIAVGAGAVVDTAGFTASALTMSDQDARAGRMRFGGNNGGTPAAGELRVQGNIIARGGDVVLVAPTIEVAQNAVVESVGGNVLLAAGQSVEVTGRGIEGISLHVQAPTDTALNLGTLKGDAVGVFASSLRHSGLIQANTANLDGGRVVLQARDEALVEGNGSILAQSTLGQGGSVQVLGTHVGLTDNARIDVSGGSGGGTILVGGDYQGKNPDIPNAKVTYVGPKVQLNASATGVGDGGKIIVWADDTTRMFGTAQARGGVQGGNGGLVEASGKKYLDFQGLTDTRAPMGRDGTLLLDPDTITIDNSVDNFGGGSFGGGIFSGATNNPTLTWATINAQTGVVQIQSSPAATSGLGDINLNASGAVTGPTTLSFMASRGINFAPNVMVTGPANLNFLAGWNGGTSVTFGALNNITLGAGAGISTFGNVWMDAGNAIVGDPTATIHTNILTLGNTTGSSLPGGANLPGPNTVTELTASINSSPAGLLFKNAQSLNIGIGLNGVNGILASNATGPIHIETTAGGISLINGIISDSLGGAPITLTSAGPMVIAAPITSTFNASTGGLVKLVSGASITGNATGVITNFGQVEILAAQTVDLTATNQVNTVAANVTGAGQVFNFTNGNQLTVGTVGPAIGITTNGGAVNLTADSLLLTQFINAGAGDVTLTSTGLSVVPVQQTTGAIVTAGALSLNAVVGSNPISMTEMNQVSALNIANASAVTFTNAGNLDLGAISATSSVTLTSATGAVTQSGTINTPVLAVNANSGITLLGANTVPQVNLLNTTTGDIQFNSNVALTVTQADNTGTGKVVITTPQSLSLTGGASSSGAGDAVILSAGTVFSQTGPIITVPGGSRWLVYSAAPPVTLAPGLVAASSFQQYGATYPATPVLGIGNGFLYSSTPALVPATLTGVVSKVFDGTNTAALTAANYLVAPAAVDPIWGVASTGATVTLTGTGTYVTPNVGTGIVVNSVGGDVVTSYSGGRNVYGLHLANATGAIGTIVAAPVSVVVTGSLTGSTTKVYDGTTNALLTPSNYSFTGFVGGDGVNVTQTQGNYASKNAGSGILVTAVLNPGDYTPLGSTLLSNYILPTSVSGNIGFITPKPVNIDGLQALNKTYDGNLVTQVSVNGAKVNGLIAGDVVTLTGASGTFAQKDVGVGMPVNLSTVQFGGADGANYSFIPRQVGVADILVRPLSTWIGGDSGLWSDPNNWDALPDKANVLAVNIPAGLGTVTLDESAGNITLGTLTSNRPIIFTGNLLQVGDVLTTGLTQTRGKIESTGNVRVTESFSQTGGQLLANSVVVNHNTGNLLTHDIQAPVVSLTARAGAILQTGALIAESLTTSSTAGTLLNGTGNRIAQWKAKNAGPQALELVNTGNLELLEVENTEGNVSVVNTGGVVSRVKISTPLGSTTVLTNSPLTIEGEGVLAKGDIRLTATNLTSAGDMLLDAPVISSAGSVTLTAANNLTQNAPVFGALGVTATAGGTLTYGPLATAGNSPVQYFVKGVQVRPPPLPSGSSDALAEQITNNEILALLNGSPLYGIDPITGLWLPGNGANGRDLNQDPLVSEGSICRP
jgi:filamentous hemagglutinin family protein